MVGHDQGRQWNYAVSSSICYHRPVIFLHGLRRKGYLQCFKNSRNRSNQTFDAMSILPTCSLSAMFVLSIGCACVIFALPLSMLNLVVFAFSLLKIKKNSKINTTIYKRLGYLNYEIYMN